MVLNLQTKFYHTLNTSAVVLWKALEGGASTEQELARKLVAQFEVEEPHALADVALVLRELEHEGLLVRAGEAG